MAPDAWFSDAERLLPLRAITQFREMSFYGSDIHFVVTLLGVNRDQVQLRTELHQHDQLVGIKDVWLGAFLNHERVDLPEDVFSSLLSDADADPAAMPDKGYSQFPEDFSHFPVHKELTPRYADLDADSQCSEAAIARYMEQARFGTLQNVDIGKLAVLIAEMDIIYGHYRPSSTPVKLVTGVSHIGNTSFHLKDGAQSRHGVHAIANSGTVLVRT